MSTKSRAQQLAELDAMYIAKLTERGYTVLRTKSYNAMTERHAARLNELRWAAEEVESSRSWASDCLAEERRLRDRCTFLYGAAIAAGASVDDLSSESRIS